MQRRVGPHCHPLGTRGCPKELFRAWQGLGAATRGEPDRLWPGSGFSCWRCPESMSFGDAVSSALSASPFTAPSSFSPARARARKAWESVSACGGNGVPIWVLSRAAATAAAPTARSESSGQGEAAVLPGGRGGAAEGTATGAGAPPGVEVKRRASGSVPRLETTPAPQPNPRERPGRRRAWRRKRPETVQFHAASGARVPRQRG